VGGIKVTKESLAQGITISAQSTLSQIRNQMNLTISFSHFLGILEEDKDGVRKLADQAPSHIQVPMEFHHGNTPWEEYI
jgi:hypothetical protein